MPCASFEAPQALLAIDVDSLVGLASIVVAGYAARQSYLAARAAGAAVRGNATERDRARLIRLAEAAEAVWQTLADWEIRHERERGVVEGRRGLGAVDSRPIEFSDEFEIEAEVSPSLSLEAAAYDRAMSALRLASMAASGPKSCAEEVGRLTSPRYGESGRVRRDVDVVHLEVYRLLQRLGGVES